MVYTDQVYSSRVVRVETIYIEIRCTCVCCCGDEDAEGRRVCMYIIVIQLQWLLLRRWAKQPILATCRTKLINTSHTLFLIIRFRNPKVSFILHDIGENSTAQEDHVLTTRRIFNTDLEFLVRSLSTNNGGSMIKKSLHLIARYRPSIFSVRIAA